MDLMMYNVMALELLVCDVGNCCYEKAMLWERQAADLSMLYKQDSYSHAVPQGSRLGKTNTCCILLLCES